MKRAIKLTESELRKIIKESVIQSLKEAKLNEIGDTSKFYRTLGGIGGEADWLARTTDDQEEKEHYTERGKKADKLWRELVKRNVPNEHPDEYELYDIHDPKSAEMFRDASRAWVRGYEAGIHAADLRRQDAQRQSKNADGTNADADFYYGLYGNAQKGTARNKGYTKK